MSDLIYRQDAIIAVRSHRIDINDPKKIVRKSYEDVIRELPSAESEIIRCKDCKNFRRWIDTDITFCDLTDGEVCGKDFCSRAERRTDE